MATEPLQVQFGKVVASALGTNEIVAAVADREIYVHSIFLLTAAAVDFTFRSGATDISGLLVWDGASKGFVMPFNPKGWMHTKSGEPLNLNLSAAVGVGGTLQYSVRRKGDI